MQPITCPKKSALKKPRAVSGKKNLFSRGIGVAKTVKTMITAALCRLHLRMSHLAHQIAQYQSKWRAHLSHARWRLLQPNDHQRRERGTVVLQRSRGTSGGLATFTAVNCVSQIDGWRANATIRGRPCPLQRGQRTSRSATRTESQDRAASSANTFSAATTR